MIQESYYVDRLFGVLQEQIISVTVDENLKGATFPGFFFINKRYFEKRENPELYEIIEGNILLPKRTYKITQANETLIPTPVDLHLKRMPLFK